MTVMFDVAVVGLGPIGAILSALLGQRGIRTLVIEKSDDVFPLPRAIVFDHEVMRTLQNIGVAEAILPVTVPFPPTEYHGLGGRVIARYQSLPPPHSQGWPPNFVFRQPPFERALRSALTRLRSVDVRISATLETITQHADHVAMEVVAASGDRDCLRARYAVGCDGGASLVRRLMGVELESLDFDEPWIVTDVLVNEDKLESLPQTVVQYCDPARPTTYVVGPGNHRRWEFMLLPGETPEEVNREEAIWHLLGRWLAPKDGQLWRAATYVFHALIAREWRRGRVFLAGDAAHMTPPFMAQGMCQGVRDAVNLAWKLAMVLEGRAADALLDTYQQERRPHVIATSETAKRMGQIICELDPAKALVRDAGMIAERGDPPAMQYRQNLIPALLEGALASEQGAPVGQLFPQPRIINGTSTARLDDVLSPWFRLALSPECTPQAVPGRLRRTIGSIGGAILMLKDAGSPERIDDGIWAVAEAEALLRTWFRQHGVVAALVRPDHHVLAVARHEGEIEPMSVILDRRLSLVG